MKILALPLIAALAVSAPASALAGAPSHPSAQGEEAHIPFINFRSIRSYEPVGDDVVYIQDQRRNWYRATLAAPCFNLQSSTGLRVDTRFGTALDHTSSFIVGRERCRIQSLVHSEAPPRRRRQS